MNKFKLITSDTITRIGKTLYRIQALKSFNDVNEGDLGGYVQSSDNLSDNGNAWLYDDAIAMNDSSVIEDAKVAGRAEIRNNAIVSGTSQVYGRSRVVEYAKVSGNARILGRGYVCGHAHVTGNSWVSELAFVKGNASVTGTADIKGDCLISDNAKVSGSVVDGNAHVGENALITGPHQLVVIQSVGPDNRPLTAYANSKGSISIIHGDYHGRLYVFERNLKPVDAYSAAIYKATIDLLKAAIKLNR